jgi:hypothetical protein
MITNYNIYISISGTIKPLKKHFLDLGNHLVFWMFYVNKTFTIEH